MKKIGRNDPCPCGSGKKFKHCCQPKDHVRTANARVNKAFIPGALQQAIENHQTGDLPQAQALYQQILQAEPKHPDALHLLGLIYHQQGKSAVAVDLIQQAIRAKPSEVIYYFNLGNMHQDIGQLDEAVAYYRQALLRAPDSVDTLSGLGTALRAQDLLDEAIASYRQALSIQPDIPEVHFNLANALLNQGRLDEAIATYRQALLLKPEDAVTYSNLLFTMQNLSTCSAEEVFREHQRYADRFETPLKSSWHRHSNNRDPARRIKVGYVSGDFRQHPVAYFIEPILSSHDKTRVEVYGYYNNTKHDRHTEQIVACTDHWVFCHDLSDAQLVECIRADGIDILIDLSGHTALNRLRVFAQKPAPLQATWFGYSGSTGLTAMDYRITDAFMDPPGLTECFHSETLIRLPDGGVAYRPEPDCPAVNELPALRSGELIFASLNTLSKINPAVVNLWARILHALPRARLMLGNVTNREIARRLLGMFSQAGIGPGQLILQPQMTMADYLALHQQIDIGLDPFPYNGGTTTMHSLWMGVPVITLA
ncbi:MAG: tetratricopeptide repeat protein, partial [Sideroxyarcus sp.]|nr:tetratricopeptide repeat protein [Sideroxyarcus sp.]